MLEQKELHINNLETPFFLMDQSILSSEVKKLNSACEAYWNNFRIAYSIKTNSFPPLLNYLYSLDLSVEAVSEDEYNLAKKAGFETNKIVCNGPVKSKQWIEELLQQEMILNIDSKREVRYVTDYAEKFKDKQIAVGIRVNVDIEKVFPNQSNAGEAGSRFGFCFENGELEKTIQALTKFQNITITGIHLHVSTKTRTPDIYRFLAAKFAEITRLYHLNDVVYFDIGGGFYGGIDGGLTWVDYLKVISEELVLEGFTSNNLTLILEPGVSLIAGCFSYYTTVIDQKEMLNQAVVVLDGSRIHIDPLMHKTSYFYKHIKCAEDSSTRVLAKQTLAGFTCLESDCFFTIEDTTEISEGDLFIFDKVGAYTLTLSPLFISYYPAVYFKKDDNTVFCTRPKWTTNEFMQQSKIN